jgi:hypothetical protein
LWRDVTRALHRGVSCSGGSGRGARGETTSSGKARRAGVDKPTARPIGSCEASSSAAARILSAERGAAMTGRPRLERPGTG